MRKGALTPGGRFEKLHSWDFQNSAVLVTDIYLIFFLTLQCQVNPDTGDPQDELTPEAVELCRQLGSKATRVSEISGGRDPAVNAAIQEGIKRVNEKSTSNAQRIQKWVVLDRDFSVGGGELGEWMRGLFY